MLLLLVGAVSINALTATNSVPSTRSGVWVADIQPSDLRHLSCRGIRIDNLATGLATVLNGSNENDFILAQPGNAVLRGQRGTDCLMGSSSVVIIDGGQGSDVCIGRESAQFVNCEVVIVH